MKLYKKCKKDLEIYIVNHSFMKRTEQMWNNNLTCSFL